MDDELLAALAGLREDIRRGSRAALAAKAAAEEALRAPDDDAWVQAVLPALDGLERCEAEGRRLAEAHAAPSGTWPCRRPPDLRTGVLVEGLRLARESLEGALAARGYALERPVDAAFDASRHRAVEVVEGAPPGRVVRVLRVGVRCGERVIREAEVAVGKEGA